MHRTPSENRPPSTVLWLALNWRGGSRRNCTTTKTSAHSPVGPGERALISHLRENRNEEQIAITVTITASFALRATVSSQNTMGKSARTKPNTRSDRAPGDVSEAARTSGTAGTWTDAKTEPHKQRNNCRSITECSCHHRNYRESF